MAQIITSLYKSYADAFALCDDYLNLAASSIEDALHDVVNVTTTGYSAGQDAAVEIELTLLGPTNQANNSASDISTNTNGLLDAIRAINNFVIANSTTSGTAKAKLDAWINTSMDAVWTDSCCPVGWANLSSDAGYDTTDWQICGS